MVDSGRRKLAAIIILALVLSAGAAARFYELSTASLSQDEAFSWRIAQLPAVEIVRRTAMDVHPPLYYLLLRGWVSLAGDSVFALRAFSGLLGVVSLAGTYLFCRELFGRLRGQDGGEPAGGALEISLLATAIVALSIFQITHGREARMYPLGGALAVFSSYLLLRALAADSVLVSMYWALYAVLATALAYTHNYGLFTVVAQFLVAAGLLRRDRRLARTPVVRCRQLQRAALAFVCVGLAYIPWLSVLSTQNARVVSQYWTPALTTASLAGAIETLFTGNIEGQGAVAGAATPALIGVVLASLLFRADAGRLIVFFLAATPFCLGLAVSWLQGRNILVGRCLFFAFPFIAIAIADLIHRLPSRQLRIGFAVAIVLNLSVQNWVCWRAAGPADKPGMRAAVELALEKHRSGDLILTVYSGDQMTADYYLGSRTQSILVSDDLAHLRHFEGASLITNDERLEASALASYNPRRIWLLRNNEKAPNYWQFPREWQVVRTWEFLDAAPYRYRVYLDLLEKFDQVSSPASPEI